jgi:glutathione S-transferase
MGITLYGIPPSHPSHAARLMAERKGVDYKMVWLLPGMHFITVRARGFRGGTVPAMKIDGRRVQDSLAISRALEQVTLDPPLFPADPTQRAEVEEAERWGEERLQNLPRRLVRWMAVHRPQARLLLAQDAKVPLPRFASWLNGPVARHLARKVEADEMIQGTIADVPPLLDHVDSLIAEGVIGGDEPNAADYQILTSVRSLYTIGDLAPATEGRPAVELAIRLIPPFGPDFPAGLLPAEWLAPLREQARS